MKIDRGDMLQEADYNVIMRRQGYIIGYYGVVAKDSMITEIK